MGCCVEGKIHGTKVLGTFPYLTFVLLRIFRIVTVIFALGLGFDR